MTRRLSDYPLIAYRRAADRAYEEHTRLTLTAPVSILPDIIRSYSDKRERLWAAYKARKSAFEFRAFVADHGLTRVFDMPVLGVASENDVSQEKAA